MDPRFYQVLHVASAILLVAVNFWAFAQPDPAGRRRVLALSGVLSLLVLVAGVGLWHKQLAMVQAFWIYLKIACWLGLSALAGIAYRRPAARVPLAFVAGGLALAAVLAVYLRPTLLP